MTPAEFRDRLKVRLIEFTDLPELYARLSKFISFDKVLLSKYGLNAKDIDFLMCYGLPADASPFLTFHAYSNGDLEEMYGLYDLPRSLFPLGQNGSGDMLGIEISSSEVVYLNHDRNMELVFINSSLLQFTESLCVYQEHLSAKTMRQCLASIKKIDVAAVQENAMWVSEVEMADDI
jgi:hypothetical protein